MGKPPSSPATSPTINPWPLPSAKTYGGVHLLFNNTGGGARSHFPDESNEEWDRVISVNLTGSFYVSRAVWPHLIDAGGGAVVNMSSLAAQRGFSPRMLEEFDTSSSSYYAAKAGVDALTRYMAGVGGKHNIRVNCVRPGQILTPGATDGTTSNPDGGHHVFEKLFNFAQILPGPGLPQDVANLVLFLASDESRFISGEIINVDGGVAAKIERWPLHRRYSKWSRTIAAIQQRFRQASAPPARRMHQKRTELIIP